MTSWFRSWHGAPTDTKWLLIAQKANSKPGIVAAFAWALIDYASQQEDRGSVKGFDIELYCAFSGFDEDEIGAIMKAFTDKGLIENERLKSWDRRQPKREDEGATERKRKQRQKDKGEDQSQDVTQCHAPETDANTETDTEIEFANCTDKNSCFSFPFSGEPFAGQVIQMDASSFDLWFQTYSLNGDEQHFRRIIAARDEWYAKQPYKTYMDQKWLSQTTEWLAKKKNEMAA